MNESQSGFSKVKTKLVNFAASIGPGVFIVGYIIGTGSVTSMASSGAKDGMSMTWVLGLSCFFTYIMMVAVDRSTILSGQTILYEIKEKLGKPIAIFIIFALILTVITSVMGVMGIATDVVREWTKPLTPSGNGINPIISAVFFNSVLYYLFWTGKHNLFLKAVALIVAIMGVCFMLAMFVVMPGPVELAKSLAPKLPVGANAHLILAGLVGTTMATVCVVTRSYLVAEKGWKIEDMKTENRDAAISLFLTFIVSASIIASAAFTMFPKGIVVENAIDMVNTLKPLAGQFATSVFVVGIIAAALSSLFPSYALGPWLICDYFKLPRKMNKTLFRVMALVIASFGFVVPVFGGKPVIIMIASQAVSPITMPLVIICTFILLNRKEMKKKYKSSKALNIGLIVTLVFSLFVSYSSIVGLTHFIKNFNY